ncbi:MAG: hypothetical protein EBR49_05105 [Betaproteobacteria bacterium]|nr:hypothetical protein [Betaproteobacteria bacterium]
MNPHHSTTKALWTCTILLGGTGAVAQQGSDEPANHYDRYTNTQLEAVCDAMSPTRYISGLMDGGWGTLGIGGKTYYYRSACYMELVRRTGRAELCAKVVERRSLLGDGSNHSPKACAEVAAAYQAREKQNAQELAAFKASVEGAFKISELQVQVLPGGHWQVEVHTEGQRSGTYQLQLVKARDGAVLRQETLSMNQPESFKWELSRSEVVASTPLPSIFPMAVRMSYLVPASAGRPAAEHSTGIRNFTLSAE